MDFPDDPAEPVPPVAAGRSFDALLGYIMILQFLARTWVFTPGAHLVDRAVRIVLQAIMQSDLVPQIALGYMSIAELMQVSEPARAAVASLHSIVAREVEPLRLSFLHSQNVSVELQWALRRHIPEMEVLSQTPRVVVHNMDVPPMHDLCEDGPPRSLYVVLGDIANDLRIVNLFYAHPSDQSVPDSVGFPAVPDHPAVPDVDVADSTPPMGAEVEAEEEADIAQTGGIAARDLRFELAVDRLVSNYNVLPALLGTTVPTSAGRAQFLATEQGEPRIAYVMYGRGIGGGSAMEPLVQAEQIPFKVWELRLLIDQLLAVEPHRVLMPQDITRLLNAVRASKQDSFYVPPVVEHHDVVHHRSVNVSIALPWDEVTELVSTMFVYAGVQSSFLPPAGRVQFDYIHHKVWTLRENGELESFSPPTLRLYPGYRTPHPGGMHMIEYEVLPAPQPPTEHTPPLSVLPVPLNLTAILNGRRDRRWVVVRTVLGRSPEANNHVPVTSLILVCRNSGSIEACWNEAFAAFAGKKVIPNLSL